jgi:DNA-directed RNA polymerase subunit K/omega
VNNTYLEKARLVVPEPMELTVLVSKRAKQLAHGARPLVKCDAEDHMDIALYEIAEGHLIIGEEDEIAVEVDK